MITAEGLTMHYGGGVVALNKASFQVNEGEVVGLLGPNGAGKSTAMKIITTYLYPTAGKASVGGKSVLDEPMAVRKLIGYLPEVLPLYRDMEVGAYLKFVGRARGLSGRALRERLGWVREACGLAPTFKKIIRELSKGFRQRTALAQALIHDPKVVILDEPTSGLDPHQIMEIRRLVLEMAKSKTVMISTHILQEAEAISDRIIIISQGRIVADGALDQLRTKAMEGERVEVTLTAPRIEAEAALSGIPGVRKVSVIADKGGSLSFRVEAALGKNVMREIGLMAAAKRWSVTELRNHPFSLEETFLALTEAEAGTKAKGEAA